MTSESKPDQVQLNAAASEGTSTPDLDFDGPDGDVDIDADAETAASLPTTQTPPKRKGGRKPIYATSEERKQRNRQAQAAFRERRTEYIKQLEIAIRQHEESLQALQGNHRAATDECLMLRYKNSLLERILLEKGIDVQAELQSKGELTAARPPSAPGMLAGPAPTAQRAIMNRHQQAQRNPSGLAPKLGIKQHDGTIRQHHQHTMSSTTSASSQIASPSTTFSTPPTAHPHSGAGSPTFSPHQDFYPSHQRLSSQFPPPSTTHSQHQIQQNMVPFPYSGQSGSHQQQLDFNNAYPGYEMPVSMPDSAGPSYPAWMDSPGDMDSLDPEYSNSLYATTYHEARTTARSAILDRSRDAYYSHLDVSSRRAHQRQRSSTSVRARAPTFEAGDSYEQLALEFSGVSADTLHDQVLGGFLEADGGGL